jgi:putative membrane protein
MKAIFLTAGAAVALAACSSSAPGGEAVTAAEAPPPPGMAAGAYMQAAASGDMFEIQSSHLALQRTCDPRVRGFAQMLIDEHTRMSNMMAEAARATGLPLPPLAMTARHAEMLQRLQAAPGTSFDAAYRAEQVAAHQEALTLHRGYSEIGDQTVLRTLAAQAVPAIQSHLAEARALPTGTPCTAPASETRRKAGERG